MADVKERIKKLLALGESTNEHEAQSALLKARELMAKHKLSALDFEDPKDAKVSHIECDVSWTTDSGNNWMVGLANVICGNYCCASAWRTVRGTRTHQLVITGVGDDVEMCKVVVEYAAGFVLKRIKIQQRKLGKEGSKSIATSYADGFILGLEIAFEDQKESHKEWGLVLVKPKEVKEYEESLGTRTVKSPKTMKNASAFMAGHDDGKNFNMNKHIGGGEG